jgi:hypothetical protein
VLLACRNLGIGICALKAIFGNAAPCFWVELFYLAWSGTLTLSVNVPLNFGIFGALKFILDNNWKVHDAWGPICNHPELAQEKVYCCACNGEYWGQFTIEVGELAFDCH